MVGFFVIPVCVCVCVCEREREDVGAEEADTRV